MQQSEYVKIIDDNQDALLWRLRLIHSAKKKIVMIAFKMKNDNSGQDVIAALTDAAERGVEIHVIVDGLGSELALHIGPEADLLVSYPNVTFQFYNPIRPGKLRKWSYRLHDKILLIDDDVYMVGGRNVLDVSIGNYADTYNIDRDVVVMRGRSGSEQSGSNEKKRVKTASSKRVCDYVQDMMESGCLVDYYRLPLNVNKNKVRDSLFTRFNNMCQLYPFIKRELACPESEGFIKADAVRMLYCSPKPRNKRRALWKQLMQLMHKGDDVLVMTPYIICNNKMYEELKEISDNKESFAVITNSPATGANYFGNADYLNNRRNIFNKGIKVYECSMDNSLHTKTILIGNSISIIGSFNFDMRSAYIDTESMLVIESEEVNRQLREYAETLIQKSRSREADGNFFYGEEFIKPEVDPVKVIFYSWLRIMILPFRRFM